MFLRNSNSHSQRGTFQFGNVIFSLSVFVLETERKKRDVEPSLVEVLSVGITKEEVCN